jgi:hypothetical protein
MAAVMHLVDMGCSRSSPPYDSSKLVDVSTTSFDSKTPTKSSTNGKCTALDDDGRLGYDDTTFFEWYDGWEITNEDAVPKIDNVIQVNVCMLCLDLILLMVWLSDAQGKGFLFASIMENLANKLSLTELERNKFSQLQHLNCCQNSEC